VQVQTELLRAKDSQQMTAMHLAAHADSAAPLKVKGTGEDVGDDSMQEQAVLATCSLRYEMMQRKDRHRRQYGLSSRQVMITGHAYTLTMRARTSCLGCGAAGCLCAPMAIAPSTTETAWEFDRPVGEWKLLTGVLRANCALRRGDRLHLTRTTCFCLT